MLSLGSLARAGPAEARVFRLLRVFAGAPRLHRSTFAADAEAAARGFAVGEAGGAAQVVHATEVHLAEGGAGDVLEAERGSRLVDGVGGFDGARLEVHHQMAGVEQGFAVVLVVQDAAAAIRRVRVNQTQRQHVAALAFVAPHRVAAAWAQGGGRLRFPRRFRSTRSWGTGATFPLAKRGCPRG